MTVEITQLLERARGLAATAEDDAAKAAYLELLHQDPRHFAALVELGSLALASGHRSAAQTAYLQAVQCHPDNPVGHVNLGTLHLQYGEAAAARERYAAALRIDPDCAEAHQGLARALCDLGEQAAAQPHFAKGFTGRSLVVQRYRGTQPPIQVLLLVSVQLGNVLVRAILDDRVFQVIALYAEFHDAQLPLPPHAVVFNAIGDADLCAPALRQAQEILKRTRAPVINPPRNVLRTGRVRNARLLAGIPGVVAPVTRRVARATLMATSNLRFPLLLRAPGFHMGQHFVRIERSEDLARLAALPGEELLSIEYLDARGADGMSRKYRVMFIDGELYPLHLAISADWKVHYFSAAMAAQQGYRDEEHRFLEDMAGTLGPRTLAALTRIATTLGLDYAGIDFGVDANGSVLLFETNATMAILTPAPDPIWDYRRAPIARSLAAATQMVRRRAAQAGDPLTRPGW
jgi:tetratricopeptide (TPR) repeat protein